MQDGKLIVLAFPDTFVKMSDELLCKFLPLVGLGTRHYIKAGHAALVLINNASGIAQYYDFGRYVTPDGLGRVRSAITDTELEIPFKAEISAAGVLENTNQFLLWLDANPDKTHGSGRLLASVCDKIDYNKSLNYILELQNRGSIPYGAFAKTGSNCSRFVTETLLAGTSDSKIIKRLKWNKKFTPSTVGNVEKAATESAIVQVYNGVVSPFNGSALKENLKNYFDKKHGKTKVEPELNKPSKNAQLLTGIGSSAWFELHKNGHKDAHFEVRRYNQDLVLDFKGEFKAIGNLNHKEPYRFVYDSHCAFCHIEQDNRIIRLEKV